MLQNNQAFNENMAMFMNRYSYNDLKEHWGMALAQICINVNNIAALNLISNWLEPISELVDIVNDYQKSNLKNA